VTCFNVPCFLSLRLAGEVFQARDISNDTLVAVKLEYFDSDPSQVEREYIIYRRLGHRAGIPKVRWYGREGEYNALVMELLGPSLYDYIIKHGPCPLAMVLSVAVQVVCSLRIPASEC
jgi:casein kinase I family protein HRR25